MSAPTPSLPTIIQGPAIVTRAGVSYYFKNGLTLNYNRATTKVTVNTVLTRLQTQPPTSQAEADAVRRVFGLQMDSPENIFQFL